MGFLDRLRRHPPATSPPPPATVRCPMCGEENRPGAVLCSICRGPLPPPVEQKAQTPPR